MHTSVPIYYWRRLAGVLLSKYPIILKASTMSIVRETRHGCLGIFSQTPTAENRKGNDESE